MKLNPEQQKAVDHIIGPCLVTACPGSGKTRVLTQRVVGLIDKQINPINLLCLTFTNKAANEMKERIYKERGDSVKGIWVGTFHSLCVAILRKFGEKVGLNSSFSIYDEKDQTALIEKLARIRGIDSKEYDPKYIVRVANNHREEISPTLQLDCNDLDKEVIDDYVKYLDEINAVDFSGLLYKTWVLLRDNPNVTTALSNRFKYISVDETQDTNTIQYEIVKLLGSHGNIFMVGDVDQGIFSWRGAKPENLEKFKKDFPNVNVITLPRNYRSKKNILIVAQNLIRNNSTSRDVELIAERGDGGHVEVKAYNSPEFEARQIAKTIKKVRGEKGFKWNDFAVLYRMNSMSQPVEMALRNEHIPYRVVGGFSFFDRSEIKTAISYLSLLSNPNDTVAFSRAIQNPKRGVAEETVGKLEKLCKEKHLSIFEAIKLDEVKLNSRQQTELHSFVDLFESYKQKNLNLQEVASGILKDSGYYSHIEKVSKDDMDSQKRIDNLNEFLVSVGEFLNGRPAATISDYLQNISLLSAESKEETDDAVTLMTMHSAKGLEFSCVFAIGIEDGKIPHYRCTEDNQIEEERRLFYVCCTRSKDNLYISYCQSRNQFGSKIKMSKSSRFLSEIH